MTAISKNALNFLKDSVDKYNNTYHKTIKMKPIYAKNDFFTEYNEESNEKDPKFKVGDHAKISRYKNICAKGYSPNWSEEIFVIKQMKNTVPWTYVISDLNGEEIVGKFANWKKNLELKKY